jgi:hypothetical protein
MIISKINFPKILSGNSTFREKLYAEFKINNYTFLKIFFYFSQQIRHLRIRISILSKFRKNPLCRLDSRTCPMRLIWVLQIWIIGFLRFLRVLRLTRHLADNFGRADLTESLILSTSCFQAVSTCGYRALPSGSDSLRW